MLWSLATWYVWLSCREHSEYTGNTHAPRVYLLIFYVHQPFWYKQTHLNKCISCSVCMGASSRGHSESREQCWSAISLLWDLHTFRQQEKDNLTKLNERWVNTWPTQPQIADWCWLIFNTWIGLPVELMPMWGPKAVVRCVDSIIFCLLDWIQGVWDCCVCTSDWQPWELKGKQYLTELFWQLGSLGRHGNAGFFLISRFYQPLSAVFVIFTHRPHIKSPHGAEQATLWLRNDGTEQKRGPISETPQQVLGIRTRGVACYKLGRTSDVRRRSRTVASVSTGLTAAAGYESRAGEETSN